MSDETGITPEQIRIDELKREVATKSQLAEHYRKNEKRIRARLDQAEAERDAAIDTMDEQQRFITELNAERDALQAVVDKLPKTADGVTLLLGSEVFYDDIDNPDGPICGSVATSMCICDGHDKEIYRGGWIISTRDDDEFGNDECYSTIDAAKASRQPACAVCGHIPGPETAECLKMCPRCERLICTGTCISPNVVHCKECMGETTEASRQDAHADSQQERKP